MTKVAKFYKNLIYYLVISVFFFGCAKQQFIRPFDYKDNQDAILQFKKALLLKEQKKYEYAIVEFRRYIDLYGDLYHGDEALYNITECLRSLEQFTEALQAYKLIIKKYKKSRYVPVSWYGMGECYKIDNKLEESIKIFIKVMKKYSKTIWFENSYKQIKEITKMFPDSKKFKKTQEKVDKLFKKLEKK